MKKFLLLALALFLVGCSKQVLTQERYQKVLDNQQYLKEGQAKILAKVDFEKSIESSPREAIKEKLDFDLDISSLDYELPGYDLICTPKVKVSCSIDECKNIKPSVFLLYNSITKTLNRCDDRPCDSYEVEDSYSGIYRNLKSLDKDLRVKIQDSSVFSDMNGNYVEINGSGLGVITSWGNCIKTN